MRFTLGSLMDALLFGCCVQLALFAGCKGLNWTMVVVQEGRDAILNCSITPKKDLRSQIFDWKKDGKMEIFFYEKGRHYNNNGRTGQDLEFRGRVSHFEDQLEHGNASIHIKSTRVNDSGCYECIFPHLKSWEEKLLVQLVVKSTFRDRSRENRQAVSKPHTEILDTTDARVLLRCDVQDAFLRPNVSWQDDGGKTVPVSEIWISPGGGRYNVSITAYVNKTATNRFTCVVRQEKIYHEVKTEIYVPVKMFQACECGTHSTLTLVLVAVASVFVILGVITAIYKVFRGKDSRSPPENTTSTVQEKFGNGQILSKWSSISTSMLERASSGC